MDEDDKRDWERECQGPALICAVLANIFRDSKKNPKHFKVTDFMPVIESKPKRNQTPEEMFAFVKVINGMHGGTVTE